ncbi:MAG: response regulator [Pseudomonadota bacterium]
MSKKNLLIVEDEPDIAAMQRDFFEMHEFKVDVVTNGIDAVKFCNQKKYDFILSDIKMPKADGFYLLENFGQQNHESGKPKFFIVSGLPDLDEENILSLRADGIFGKPINFGKLLNAMHKA